MQLSNRIEGLISNFEREKTNTSVDVPVADLGLTATVPAR